MRVANLSGLITVMICASQPCHASIVLTSIAPSYSQNFDETLVVFDTSAVLPASWALSETGSGADATYAADDGGASVANTYSYGASGSTDRALGTLRSSPLAALFFSTIGAAFKNDDTVPIESLTISYRGEEWRLGTSDRADQLDFQYSVDASSLTSGSWTDVDELDFVTPNTTGSTILDGNLAANSQSVSHTISNLSIPPSSTFWIRWTDLNASGADDGLAVDDFQITAAFVAAVPEPGAVLFGSLACSIVGLGFVGRWLVVRLLRRSAA